MLVNEYRIILNSVLAEPIGEYVIGVRTTDNRYMGDTRITDLPDDTIIIVNYEFMSKTLYPQLTQK